MDNRKDTLFDSIKEDKLKYINIYEKLKELVPIAKTKEDKEIINKYLEEAESYYNQILSKVDIYTESYNNFIEEINKEIISINIQLNMDISLFDKLQKVASFFDIPRIFIEKKNIEQNILFTKYQNTVICQSIEYNEFQKKFSRDYFKHENGYTLKNFNQIWLDAKEKIKSGSIFEETNLYRILMEIETEEMVLWYGEEYDFLAGVKSFNDLIKTVKKMLVEGNGELNIIYRKEDK
jgi:hypothetical protein